MSHFSWLSITHTNTVLFPNAHGYPLLIPIQCYFSMFMVIHYSYQSSNVSQFLSLSSIIPIQLCFPIFMVIHYTYQSSFVSLFSWSSITYTNPAKFPYFHGHPLLIPIQLSFPIFVVIHYSYQSTLVDSTLPVLLNFRLVPTQAWGNLSNI